ncbi:MAG: DUF169 domain-containing protein [Candidatus Hadarchaeales archaeon]
MEEWRTLGKELEERLRPATYPLAVTFLKGEEVPEGVRRPEEKFSLCQLFTLSRTHGWTMVLEPENSGCPALNSILGWPAEREMVIDFLQAAGYVKGKEAAEGLLRELENLGLEGIRRVVVSPLTRTKVVPEVVVIYGNSAQMMRLIQGAVCEQGRRIEVRMAGLMGSCGSVLRSYAEGKYDLAIPGTGDRVFAATQETEIVFTLPAFKLRPLLEGMKEQKLIKYPVPPRLLPPFFPGG